MLLVVHGTDFKKARAKTSSLLKGLEKKRPDAQLFTLTDESFSTSGFEELLEGQGLFERKYIVFLNRVFDSAEGEKTIVSSIKRMCDSENIFLLYEPTLSKKNAKKMSKCAYKIFEFTDQKKKKKEFKLFGLTDAVGERNAKGAWLELQRARSAGKSVEEIYGVLFWYLKTMLIVHSSDSAKDAGIKSFVYKKAQKNLSRWKKDDLFTFSREFISEYHEARRGKGDLGQKIERMLLEL